VNTELIVSALRAAGVQASVLDVTEQHALLARLRERLGVDVTAHAPWDHPAAPSGRRRGDGWELVPARVGAEPCLVFLDGAATVWSFASGLQLLAVLKEAPPLEFYVCDQDASYLLCCNHHDVMIGWGTAEAWVESLDETEGV
jgi:hypothetical protein